MKSKILIVGAMLGTVVIGPAMAVTKCVNLGLGNKCAGTADEYQSNWMADCFGTLELPLRGVAVCASTVASGGSPTSRTFVSFSNVVDENKYCWCRLVSPAVSGWVSNGYGNYSTYSKCVQGCAKECVENVRTPGRIQNLLLGGSLSD